MVEPANPANSKACVIRVSPAYRPLPRVSSPYRFRHLRLSLAARVAVYRYVKPRAAKWPKADFIVGNPPFIGNKRMRERRGENYARALRSAWPKVPKSVDPVMYWRDRCAELAQAGEARSFGLVSTNNIKQITQTLDLG